MWQKNRAARSFINQRARILTLVIILSGGMLILRLFFLQIVEHETFLDLARRQQQISETTETPRGAIYFREAKTNALVNAATTQQGYLLYLDNRTLINPEETFSRLNTITPIDRDIFFTITKKTNDPYEVLKQRITLEEGNKISVLRIPGVGLVAKSWRWYPGEQLAGHVLGFVSSAADNIVGQYGVEKYYESTLKGNAQSFVAEKDANGFFIALGRQFVADTSTGHDIVLTIEPTVERSLQAELEYLRDRWHARSGGIIIVEPKTGAIRGLAAYPIFDPNGYFKEKDLSVFLNPFVQKIFELGSVFKPLTMAAALDQGVLTPDTTYVDRGFVKIGSATIKNFDEKARGVRTMTQVLEESLNTGAIFAMQQLGKERLRDYFHAYGLSERLGVDLPGEVAGNLSNLESGREIEFATASFGQGVAVSPLELTMALASLGNGGKLLRPYIKEQTIGENPTQPTIIRHVIKPETSTTITRMLVDVVDRVLAGGKVKKIGYSIAAKTGTAQIPNENGKGYYPDQYLHAFFGYFPAYDPQFLIVMFLERPQGVRYASQSLSDSFVHLVDFLINYYTIPPDRADIQTPPALYDQNIHY